MRSFIRNHALARKLTESTANTHPGAVNTTRIPATAGPKTFIALFVIPSSAFAGWSRSALIVCGTRPSDAGPKNADAVPKTAAVTRKIGSVIWCVRSMVAVNASMHARDAVAGEHHRAARQAIGDDAADEREGDPRDPEAQRAPLRGLSRSR